MITMHRLGHS